MTATRTSLPELQTAFFARLVPGPNGAIQTDLANLGVTGVFDFGMQPENQAFPYITLFSGSPERPDNAFGTRGYVATAQIDIWSIYAGYQECYSILNILNDLFDQQLLSLATHHHVYTLYNFGRPLGEPKDERIRRFMCQYNTFTQET
jgi:hypothetical protein